VMPDCPAGLVRIHRHTGY